MTDKKITQEQIIKALEICSSDAFNDSKERCTGCKYDGADKNLFCFEVLEKDALDLINRQKAENDCLRKELEKLHSHKEFLRAEIERLQETYRKRVGEEIEETYNYLLEEIKTEAIKEFAERLKEPYKDYDKNVGVVGKTTLFNDIDNLVKEMTE